MSHETSAGTGEPRRGAARPSGTRSIFDSCENMFFRDGEHTAGPAEVDDFKDLDEGFERKRLLSSRKLLFGFLLAGTSLLIAGLLAFLR